MYIGPSCFRSVFRSNQTQRKVIERADSTMTAMLRILSIAAFIAVASAGITDYSSATLQEIFTPGSGSIAAQLINGDIEIELLKNSEAKDKALALLPGPSSPSANKDETCGGDLGVVLNGENHCTLSSVTVKQVEKSGKQGIQLELAFKLEKEPTVLAVPILKIPSENTSASEKWLADNNVVLAPSDVEKLSDINGKKSVKIGFKWLSDLLAQGVTESAELGASVTVAKLQIDCKSYITKPLVVSEAIAQKLAAIVA